MDMMTCGECIEGDEEDVDDDEVIVVEGKVIVVGVTKVGETRNRKNKEKQRKMAERDKPEVVDLTLSPPVDNGGGESMRAKKRKTKGWGGAMKTSTTARTSTRTSTTTSTTMMSSAGASWNCTACTLINGPLVLACMACSTPRELEEGDSDGEWEAEEKAKVRQSEERSDELTTQAAKTAHSRISVQDAPSPKPPRKCSLIIPTPSSQKKTLAEEERDRAKDTYGFDIYGSQKAGTGTLKHLT